MSEKWARFEDAALRRGFAQVPNVVMRDGRLSMQAKYLYGLLLSYAWQDDEAHPGVKALCRDAGVGKDTLAKYVHELSGAGLIEVKRRGRGMTNLYIFKALSSGLESDTGSHLESDTGSVPDGDTGSDKEYSVNEYSEKEENTSKDVDASASPGKFVGYLREELDGADVPLLRNREDRYAGEFNKLIKKGITDDMLYKVCDRIAGRWKDDEHRKLTAEQALEDVVNGKAPRHVETNGASSGTPPEVIEYIISNNHNDFIVNYRSVMAKWDFTSSEPPPYNIEAQLGGTPNERWANLSAIQTLARRAVREGTA